jgi:hypothetical protein
MPKAAANAITATKTKILGFTELTHFLHILNVEIDIIILKNKIKYAIFSSCTTREAKS